MARSKKKTTRDRLFEAAIAAAPAPVRTIASNPIGFRLLMIAGAALMATGILTLDWRDGVPHFNFNREKAREVRQELVQDIGQQVQKWEHGQGISIPDSWKGQLQPGNPPGHMIQTPLNGQGQAAGFPQHSFPQQAQSYQPGFQGAWGQQPAAPTSGYYQPNSTPPAQPLQGQFPQGQYLQGQYPQGQFLQGQIPNAQFPQGQLPQGQYYQGQYPQQQYSYPSTGTGYPQDYRR